jgi:hypothetical protein
MTFSNVSGPWRIQDPLTHVLQIHEEEDVAVDAAVGRLEDAAVEQLEQLAPLEDDLSRNQPVSFVAKKGAQHSFAHRAIRKLRRRGKGREI